MNGMIRYLYKETREWLRDKLIVEEYRSRLRNKSFSIISSDCTGGRIYHDLGLPFTSPTINLYMSCKDYIEFCKDIHYWINQPMIEINRKDLSYPVATLGRGICLYLVHYKSVDEAQISWNRRKERIDFDNIFLLCNDRNGCNYSLMKEFDDLPFEKVLFTHNKQPTISSSYYINGNAKENSVPVMTDWKNKLSIRRNYDDFDYVSWLNRSRK